MPAAVLTACCAAIFLTTPADSAFFNEDAPRHALNGAFVHDFLRAWPLHAPIAWAIDYYLKYPSLSIGFYPPLFYAVEACVFGVLGVGHAAANASVALATFCLGLCAYGLARFVLPRQAALACAIMLLGLPEMLIWERQVMLDIPVHAALLLAVLATAQFCRTGAQRWLVLAAAALLAGVYIKFNLLFILPSLLLAVLSAQGGRAVLHPRVVLLALLSLAAMAPALLLAAHFADVHGDNLGGRVGGLPFSSPENWLQYARMLPQQLGWPALILAMWGLAGALLGGGRGPGPGPGPGSGTVHAPPALIGQGAPVLSRWFLVLLATWLGGGYVIFSAVRVHEPRHDLMLFFPLMLAAAATLHRVLPQGLVLPAALAMFTGNLALHPAARINGWAEVAGYVSQIAPPQSRVMFAAYRDGNFSFALRAAARRPDLDVVRANKYFMHFAVNRNWGLTQEGFDEPGMRARLHDLGVGAIVVQEGFWSDIGQMALLQQIARGAHYRLAARFRITGDLGPQDGAGPDGASQVDVFVPLEAPRSPPLPLEFDLPFLHQRLQQDQPEQTGA